VYIAAAEVVPLCRMTECTALAVPIVTLPKESAVGVMVMTPEVEPDPDEDELVVPVRIAVYKAPPVFTTRFPVNVPAEAGAKVTLIVQEALAFMRRGQLSLSPKFAGTEILLKWILPPVLLVNVTT
jgi:hypothetical protein